MKPVVLRLVLALLPRGSMLPKLMLVAVTMQVTPGIAAAAGVITDIPGGAQTAPATIASAAHAKRCSARFMTEHLCKPADRRAARLHRGAAAQKSCDRSRHPGALRRARCASAAHRGTSRRHSRLVSGRR